jgi:hypothetical protein
MSKHKFEYKIAYKSGNVLKYETFLSNAEDWHELEFVTITCCNLDGIYNKTVKIAKSEIVKIEKILVEVI